MPFGLSNGMSGGMGGASTNTRMLSGLGSSLGSMGGSIFGGIPGAIGGGLAGGIAGGIGGGVSDYINNSLFGPNHAGDTRAYNELFANMRQQQQEYSNNTLGQYNGLMKTVGDTRNAVNSNIDALGQTGMTQIAQGEKRQAGQTEQDLTSRGLGNTTIRSGALNGVANNAQMQRQALGEAVAGQKIGANMQLGQMQGDAQLSRQFAPPDLGGLLGAMQGLNPNLLHAYAQSSKKQTHGKYAFWAGPDRNK